VKLRFPLQFLLSILFLAAAVSGQSPNSTISGLVLDPSGRLIVGADILVLNDATGLSYLGATNSQGIYAITNLPPGPYRIQVSKFGFKSLIKPDIVLNVQSAASINFTLPVGALSEIVTVEGGSPLVNTESASVSTVVDRQFAENLPMNGRTFQTLIELAPGVVTAGSNLEDGGQFNVNGQRANANYWTVDGVGANVGIASYSIPGNGLSGSLGSFSALGGTNSLVSVDALQEFRIQTSTYAPEFGRTPGGQISIVTRSGTNAFHGSAFDYLRNDLLDANDWFGDFAGLPKPEERQNDFGGTLSGPILKDRTFFFFSYEGLRLRLPQTLLSTVPDVTARQNALPAMQPYLNVFPLPNGLDDPATSTAPFDASFSNPGTLDAYSLRIDHRLTGKVTLFGRYNDSPSGIVQRAGGGNLALSQLFSTNITTQTATLGSTFLLSRSSTNDLRFNYSRTNASTNYSLDNFGGAVPLTSEPFPGGYSSANAQFAVLIASLVNNEYLVGDSAKNTQRQFNIVDSLSIQRGSHSLKFGIDYRRLSPDFSPFLYQQTAGFFSVSSAANGDADLARLVQAGQSATFLFQNLGSFAQDTWRVKPRLTLNYGLRWDVDFAPASTQGPSIPSVTGFNLLDLSSLKLAPVGRPPFGTKYDGIAPRLGIAYQVLQNPKWGTVLRGGVGVFYDLADGEVGNLVGNLSYPFGAFNVVFPGGPFPFSSGEAAPPPITAAGLSTAGSGPLTAFNPNLQLPYSLEWNLAVEQSLGPRQSAKASYIGSQGKRLIQTAAVSSPNLNFASADLVTNAATSDYDALQLQFQRQLSSGLQTLISYTWAHSIDTASAGSNELGSNTLLPSAASNQNRGPSDFDLRQAFSAGITYEVPTPKVNRFTNAIVHGWSLESVILAHSAPPVNVYEAGFSQLNLFSVQVRPDVVPGQALYLYGANCASVFQSLGSLKPGQVCPGNKGLNPAAFAAPPSDQNGNALRQGNLGRNALRGFGLAQWDFAVHRDFSLHECVKLQFRAEMFNVLNHPNLASPYAGIDGSQTFGLASQTLAQGSGGNTGNGGLSALYSVGGPRSVQVALKIQF
jgi:hypothetical protein